MRPEPLRHFSRENAGGEKSTSVSGSNRKRGTKCCESHGFAVPAEGAVRDGGRRSLRQAHETESEFSAGRPAALHETASELAEEPHETTSEFLKTPHEIKSEFTGRGPAGAHESKSESVEIPHESKSEFSGEGAAKGKGAPDRAKRAAAVPPEGGFQAAGTGSRWPKRTIKYFCFTG